MASYDEYPERECSSSVKNAWKVTCRAWTLKDSNIKLLPWIIEKSRLAAIILPTCRWLPQKSGTKNWSAQQCQHICKSLQKMCEHNHCLFCLSLGRPTGLPHIRLWTSIRRSGFILELRRGLMLQVGRLFPLGVASSPHPLFPFLIRNTRDETES